eukprot:SAG22_NODE_502_length_9704_cov_23.436439_9_plen_61_part_00
MPVDRSQVDNLVSSTACRLGNDMALRLGCGRDTNQGSEGAFCQVRRGGKYHVVLLDGELR